MSFQKFFISFFQALDEHNILYLVERNYEQLPDNFSNDVDFLLFSKDKAKFISLAICAANETNLKTLSVSSAYGGGRLYFYNPNDPHAVIMRLDYTTILHYRGIKLLNADKILKQRVRYNLFYIPTQGMESAISLMTSWIYRGVIKDKYKEKIYNGVINDKKNFEEAFNHLLPYNKIILIEKYLREKRFDALQNKRKIIITAYSIKNITLTIYRFLICAINYLGRLFDNPGIFICIVGVDGAGKSSLAQRLQEKVSTIYPGNRFLRFHWRPGLFPKLSKLIFSEGDEIDFNNINLDYAKPKNVILSILRWLYYSLDFTIGYYLKILPKKMSSTAIVIERYYYDILVDNRRYGFNLPYWLLRSIVIFIPKPDLTIYLDNTAATIHERKQEMATKMLSTQINAWRELIPLLPNPKIIFTDKPLEELANECSAVILSCRAEMTEKSLGTHNTVSKYLWSAGKKYVSLPSKRNCRWIVPCSNKLSSAAWSLYRPFSFYGRMYKKFSNTISMISCFWATNKINEGDLNSSAAMQLKELAAAVLKRDDIIMAVSAGNPSAFRKITGVVMSLNGEVLSYVKIGNTGLAIERIKKEADVLKQITGGFRKAGIEIEVPKCLYSGELKKSYIIMQSPLFCNAKSGKRRFNLDYAAILENFLIYSKSVKKFSESEFYKKIKTEVGIYPLSFRNLLKETLSLLEENILDKKIYFSLSHGDFAPWNILRQNKKFFIYDWETACFDAPVGIDMVHFNFQTGNLLWNLDAKALLNFILSNQSYEILTTKLQISLMNPQMLLLCYLLKMAVDEDKYQLLSEPASQRRKLMKLLS